MILTIKKIIMGIKILSSILYFEIFFNLSHPYLYFNTLHKLFIPKKKKKTYIILEDMYE